MNRATTKITVGQLGGGVGGPMVSTRTRFTAAEINAGASLLAGVSGYAPRLVDVTAIAIGGAAAGLTTLDLSGMQTSVVVKLATFAMAQLLQDVPLRIGATGVSVLAGGASFVGCDDAAGFTIGKTGGSLTGATHVDVVLSFVLE